MRTTLLEVGSQALKCIVKNDGASYFQVNDKVTVAIDPDDLMVY